MKVYRREHPRADRNGYVQRAWLVAEAMLQRALFPSEIVHHKNRVKDDDHQLNLQVLPSRSAHMRLHGVEDGTWRRFQRFHGEQHGMAKLTDVDVLTIRRLYTTAFTKQLARELGQRYGVGATHIRKIWRGTLWMHDLEPSQC